MVLFKFFKTYKPKSLILFETEIWPNMISQASNKKISVILSNGRMSESSFNRYKKLKFYQNQFFQKLLMLLFKARPIKKDSIF